MKNRFTQTIRTRDFSGSQTLPSVNFNLSCILAAFADEYVAETVLRPDLDIVIGHGATAKNNFTVFMDTYETGLFETPALDNIVSKVILQLNYTKICCDFPAASLGAEDQSGSTICKYLQKKRMTSFKASFLVMINLII